MMKNPANVTTRNQAKAIDADDEKMRPSIETRGDLGNTTDSPAMIANEGAKASWGISWAEARGMSWAEAKGWASGSADGSLVGSSQILVTS